MTCNPRLNNGDRNLHFVGWLWTNTGIKTPLRDATKPRKKSTLRQGLIFEQCRINERSRDHVTRTMPSIARCQGNSSPVSLILLTIFLFFISLWWKRHGMALEFLTSYFITNLWNFDSVFIKRCFCVKFSKDAAMSINTPFLNESSFISIKCNDAPFKNTLFTQRSFQCLLKSLLNPPSYW